VEYPFIKTTITSSQYFTQTPTSITTHVRNHSNVSCRASDKCIAEKRKTITGDDILVAMATLGFDNYVEPLKLYLRKYREVGVS